MIISCLHPSEIREVQSLDELTKTVQMDNIPIAKYIFSYPQRSLRKERQERLFHDNLDIRTSSMITPLPSVEMSFIINATVVGKNGIFIKDDHDEIKALLHPFYELDRFFGRETWNSSYVKKMNLEESAMKVVGLNKIKALSEIKSYFFIEEPVFMFGTPADANYSHFIWDSLPQLWYLKQIKSQKIKILVE